MKIILFVFVSLILSLNVLAASNCGRSPSFGDDLSRYFKIVKAKEEGAFKLTPFEQQFLDEVNLARTNPRLYADILREHLASFTSEKTFKENGILYGTQEGKKAVEEAIAFLETQKELPALSLSQGMTLAGRDHVNDLGPKNLTGHYGSNKEDPVSRIKKYGVFSGEFAENISYSSQSPRGHVIALIVDDGVMSRGHRKNIFNPALKTAGIGCGAHEKYTRMCVMDFAGKFTDKKTGGPILVEEF